MPKHHPPKRVGGSYQKNGQGLFCDFPEPALISPPNNRHSLEPERHSDISSTLGERTALRWGLNPEVSLHQNRSKDV